MKTPNIIDGTTRYYYVGKKNGIFVSHTKEPPNLQIKEKMSYLGYSNEIGLPKVLNTGRVLYPKKKKHKKSRKMPKI